MNQVINELLREATILSLLQEKKMSWDEFVNNAPMMPNPEARSKKVKFSTALSYGSSAKGGQGTAYTAAKNHIQKAIDQGTISPEDAKGFDDEKVSRGDGVDQPTGTDGPERAADGAGDRLSGDELEKIGKSDTPQTSSKKEKTKKKKEEKSDGHFIADENGQLDKIRKSAFSKGSGMSASYGTKGQKGDPTDENWPNDALAKQTSWETGHSKGTPSALSRSPTTRRRREAAPGDAGSLLNELGSNEIADMLHRLGSDGDNLSDEQLAQILHDQFKSSHAAKQNGFGSKDPLKIKNYNSKIMIAAQAGRRKYNRMKEALENAPDIGDIENVETFYGSADSINAARKQVQNAERFFGQTGEITEVPTDERTRDEFREAIGSSVLAAARRLTDGKKTTEEDLAGLYDDGKGELPFPDYLLSPESVRDASGKLKHVININEEKLNEYIAELFPEDPGQRKDPEKIKKFMEATVLSAGGGNNPTDTTTFMKDNKDNLIVLQHSDKLNLKAQLANSTPNKEANRAIEEIERLQADELLAPEVAAEAYEIIDSSMQEIKKEEAKLSKVKEKPLEELAEFTKKPKNARMILQLIEDPEGDTTIKPKALAMIEKFRGKNNEEKLHEFFKQLAGPGHKVTADQNRIIEKLRIQMTKQPDVVKKDGEPWGAFQLDSSQEQGQIRKSTIRLLQDRVAELNEINVSVNDKDVPLGDVIETRKLIDVLHLYQVDVPPRGVFIQGMTEIVAGADGVTAENLRDCLNLKEGENSEDLVGRIKVGPPIAPEGERWVADEELGVPEAFLRRDIKLPEVNEEGKVYYWLYKDGKRVDKTTDKEAAAKTVKNKVAVPVGTVTSQAAMAYWEDEKGQRREIASFDIRAKGGPQTPLGTGYAWSKEMEDCLGNKKDKANESFYYLKGYTDMEYLIEMAKQV